MKQMMVVAGVAAAVALPIHAEAIKPVDVVFTDGAVETSLSGQPGDPAEGQVLMNKGAGNCIACHAVSELSDLPFHGEVGPPLDGVADRWTEAELRGIVSNSKEMFPGSVMPSFYRTTGFIRPGEEYTGKAKEGDVMPLLTAQQVEDVVAYLLTLKE
jgi:sulfur-oxidizing protein SoxX